MFVILFYSYNLVVSNIVHASSYAFFQPISIHKCGKGMSYISTSKDGSNLSPTTLPAP